MRCDRQTHGAQRFDRSPLTSASSSTTSAGSRAGSRSGSASTRCKAGRFPPSEGASAPRRNSLSHRLAQTAQRHSVKCQSIRISSVSPQRHSRQFLTRLVAEWADSRQTVIPSKATDPHLVALGVGPEASRRLEWKDSHAALPLVTESPSVAESLQMTESPFWILVRSRRTRIDGAVGGEWWPIRRSMGTPES